MKNRFYFSLTQQTPWHRCWVFNGKEYLEYTEWVSVGEKPVEKNAKLVYETDEDNPDIKVLGEIETPY